MPGGLEVLIEPKTLSILKTLLKNPGKIFHLNSLAKSSKISVSSTARIIKKLVKNNFAEELKVGKWSVYQLADNKQTREFKRLL
jgi:DNA-binding MarR family transcriptional regulator